VSISTSRSAPDRRARVLLHGQRVAGRRGQVVVDGGERFVVPVQTLNAAPNPKYFLQKHHGLTWLSAINDQVAGIGAIVVPGTMRDSLHILIPRRDFGVLARARSTP
jgi:TnpA family transposase